ncbi:hypothetical protein NV226_02615 [Mycoplasma iguanae]|uniref:Uncharacterized protein n=1 Tax=Mycoplasma iguanae TaxID=292461 RepID=A0ABY5R9Y8_9MOLU|nr:hypothetical protein [Mycoplasma iguanae]UVD81594.1 hypothetical protein NV226_02615 [Mycoplasma iguanae]
MFKIKKDIFDNFKNLNNLLNDLDSKFISQINKLDLLFIFLGKKHQQRQKIKNYKKLFLKYQTNNVLSHLEQINYLFASDKSELKNQDLILGIYFLTDIFKRLKLEYKILWDNYEDLTIEEKIKLNLAISQFLDSKIYLLDLNIYQLSVETREIISNFLKNKTTIYFGNWEVVKNSDINYAMFFTRGLILEMAPKKTFFNKPINNYLSHFLKTKEWDYSKIENLNNDQYWQLIHEKKYVKISENHWSYINNTSGKKAKIEGKNGKKV